MSYRYVIDILDKENQGKTVFGFSDNMISLCMHIFNGENNNCTNIPGLIFITLLLQITANLKTRFMISLPPC